MGSILIKGAQVVDPKSETVNSLDVYIEDGKIVKIAKGLRRKADEVIDGKGCYLMPGFVDLHVHLRDPGFEYKETVDTGAMAGAHGGYTTILAMPNTKPVVDRADIISYVHNKAKNLAPIRVLQIGAITKKQAGKELADIEDMVKAGAPAISEDGKSVMDSGVYKDAMIIARNLDIPVFAHCEDVFLVRGGVMNDDKNAHRLGLPGIANTVENVIELRDILIAEEVGAKLHLCHCSTKESVVFVRSAKQRGVKLTAEVCPHHFTLTSDDIKTDDANFKMNPPLRTREDVDALIAGLKMDVMDVIATDHAPHSEDEKADGFKKSPFGIVGLETAAALTYDKLVKPGHLDIIQMAKKMSYNPAQVIGLDAGYIEEGAPAELVLFDPKRVWTVDKKKFASKGKNTPFHGTELAGKVRMTIFGGQIVYRDEENNQ